MLSLIEMSFHDTKAAMKMHVPLLWNTVRPEVENSSQEQDLSCSQAAIENTVHHLLTGLRSLGLLQSKTGENLNRISIIIVPEPFFLDTHSRKKVVWLRKTYAL